MAAIGYMVAIILYEHKRLLEIVHESVIIFQTITFQIMF